MLFSDNPEQGGTAGNQCAPLAESVRPSAFDHIYGQDKIWAPGGLLRKLVEEDRFWSLIFWGPPGTGKTSVAGLIGASSGRPVRYLSAVNAGVKDIRGVIHEAEHSELKPVLFMDEVHRLSRNQQDVLLPSLEAGSVRFIGATTENPSFEVNHAVNSRSLVFRFEKINDQAMTEIFARAVRVRQSAASCPDVDRVVLEKIAVAAAGDARKGLNLLEAALTYFAGEEKILPAHLKKLGECMPGAYDKSGDQHYDIASAMIKSIRGSHPDAALYYLARMIEGGEKPEFIARRLVISAAEDIGNANPHALSFATAAAQAVHMLGMPEARIVLGQICTFLASSPKSNSSYLAMDKALETVRKTGDLTVPLHLRNAPTSLMQEFGYGEGYAYAHSDIEGAKKMTYLPKELENTRFYEPGESGFEKNIRQTLDRLRPHAD